MILLNPIVVFRVEELQIMLNPGKGRFVVSDIYATSPIPEEYRNDTKAIAECWAGALTRSEYLEIFYNAGFVSVKILEESTPYTKGKAEIASFTIAGEKPDKRKLCACRI